MKKMLLVAVFLCFGLAPHALAQQDFVPLAVIPGLTDLQPAGGLAAFFNNLYKYLIGLAAVLAIIEIIWGGLEYSTQDSISSKSNAKERIYNAIFGLVLVLSPVLVFSIINPSILNLSLNLPELPAPPPRPGPGPRVVPPPTPGSTFGCTVSSGYFRKATCPTAEARDKWIASCTNGRAKAIPDGTFAATCDTTSGPATGPYTFMDVGRILSNLQPVASTPSSPNNGDLVMQFANQCKADGGGVCLVLERALSPTCPAPFQSKTCFSAAILCLDRSLQLSGKICVPTSPITTIVK